MKIWSWRHAIQVADIPSVTKLVLLNLSIYHNDRGEGFWPSYERQAIDTGLSRRAVIEHIHKAVELGFLEKQSELRDNGSASSNRYFPCIPDSAVVHQDHQGVVHEDNHPSESPALGVVHQVHPHIESNKILSIDNNINNTRSKKKISLAELSTDHVADWLAQKRSEGRYLNHDAKFVLEKFKDYCQSNGKKYSDYIAAYRNSFDWEKFQPKNHRKNNAKTGYSDILAAGIRANAAEGEFHSTIPTGNGQSNFIGSQYALNNQADYQRDNGGSGKRLLQHSPSGS